MIRHAALLSLLALGGCSIVEVRADGGRPQIGLYPLGVYIARGDAKALSASTRTLGLVSGCGQTSAGAVSSDCDLIDVKACSAALVHARVAKPSILDRLAGATRAVCPNPKGAS